LISNIGSRSFNCKHLSFRYIFITML